MREVMKQVFTVIVACLLSATVSAQWRPYVRADVPRTTGREH